MELTQNGGIWASFSTVAVESGIVLMSLLVTASPAVGASFQLPLKPRLVLDPQGLDAQLFQPSHPLWEALA